MSKEKIKETLWTVPVADQLDKAVMQWAKEHDRNRRQAIRALVLKGLAREMKNER